MEVKSFPGLAIRDGWQVQFIGPLGSPNCALVFCVMDEIRNKRYKT